MSSNQFHVTIPQFCILYQITFLCLAAIQCVPTVQEQANLPYRKEVGGPVRIFMDAIKIRRHNLQIVQYYVIIVLIGNYLPGGDEKWQLTF